MTGDRAWFKQNILRSEKDRRGLAWCVRGDMCVVCLVLYGCMRSCMRR